MKVINPDTGEMMHYSLSNNDHVHIKNLGQYFSTSIEALLISQRRLHIKVLLIFRYHKHTNDASMLINKYASCTPFKDFNKHLGMHFGLIELTKLPRCLIHKLITY